MQRQMISLGFINCYKISYTALHQQNYPFARPPKLHSANCAAVSMVTLTPFTTVTPCEDLGEIPQSRIVK